MKNIKRQLSQADPMNHVALHALPDAAVKALAQEIVMHEQTTDPSHIRQPPDLRAAQKRRHRRRVALALIASGIIAVPGVAVAVVGGMHTGMFVPFPPKGMGSMQEPGEEILNSDDPQIRSVVQGLTSEFPLPAGASYSPLLKRYPDKVRGYITRMNLAQDVSFYAQCAWYQDWLKGDATQRAADQPTIDAMPTWKYWRYATDDATGEGGGPESGIAAETRVGKTTMITQHIEANCLGGSPLMHPDPTPQSDRKTIDPKTGEVTLTP